MTLREAYRSQAALIHIPVCRDRPLMILLDRLSSRILRPRQKSTLALLKVRVTTINSNSAAKRRHIQPKRPGPIGGRSI